MLMVLAFLEDLPGPIYPSDLRLLLFNVISDLLGNRSEVLGPSGPQFHLSTRRNKRLL